MAMRCSDVHIWNAFFPISSTSSPRTTVECPILNRLDGQMDYDMSCIPWINFTLPPMLNEENLPVLVVVVHAAGILWSILCSLVKKCLCRRHSSLAKFLLPSQDVMTKTERALDSGQSYSLLRQQTCSMRRGHTECMQSESKMWRGTTQNQR